MSKQRKGKWHVVNRDFNIERYVADEELLDVLVDRYGSTSEVRYVGPEVQETNDAWRKGKR